MVLPTKKQIHEYTFLFPHLTHKSVENILTLMLNDPNNKKHQLNPHTFKTYTEDQGILKVSYHNIDDYLKDYPESEYLRYYLSIYKTPILIYPASNANSLIGGFHIARPIRNGISINDDDDGYMFKPNSTPEIEFPILKSLAPLSFYDLTQLGYDYD